MADETQDISIENQFGAQPDVSANTPAEVPTEEVPQVPSIEDHFAYNPVDKNEFAQAQTIRFGAPDLARYLTYGSKTFGDLGYNPTIKSMEEVYLQNTTASDDYRRAWAGHRELWKIGWKDTFGFGMTKDKDNASQFHDVMANYAPTQGRDEWTSFWSNTILSAGYTTGIISAIAAEELIYAGVTLATGGLGAPLAAGEQASLGTRAMYNLNRGARMLQASRRRNKVFGALYRMRTINNSRIARGTGEFIYGIGKNVRPLGNTMDFVRNAHKMGDMNKVQKALTGAGAMARDARMAYLTHSESLLESDFTKQETLDIYLKEWYKKNPGQKMPNDIYQDILHKAEQAGEMTYWNNYGAIYITNALTFNGLFKGFSPTNSWFGRYKGGFRVKGRGPTRKVLAVDNNLVENLRRKAAGITWHGTLGKVVEMSGEGVQEVTQDIISSAAKKYAGIKTIVTPTGVKYELPSDLGRGKKSDYAFGSALNELGDSMGDTSWHTFLTGAAIGIFAGPVNIATQVASDYTVGSQNYLWTKAGREKNQAMYQEREKKAQLLTEVFNLSGAQKFLEETGRGAYEQVNSMEKLLEAAEKGDKKYFEDKKGEVFRNGIAEVFKNGLQDEYISYLKDLHNYTPQELNEAFDRTDITENNKAEFMELSDQYVDRIEKMAKRYEELQDDPRFTTLDDFTQYDPKSKEGEAQAYRRYAISQLKKEMLFAGDIIEERFNRLKSLSKKLTANGYMSESDLFLLYNQADIQEELKTLTIALKSDQEYNTDNTPEYSRKKARYEALQEQMKLLQKADQLSKQKDLTEDEVLELKDEMREVFKSFINSTPQDQVRTIDQFYNQPGSTQVDEEKFDMYWDYMSLSDDLGYYQNYVETLNDPTKLTDKVEALEEIFKQIDENKKQHILNSLKAADEKKTAETIIKKFLDMGMVFDLNEIDDLVQNGIMPKKIYNLETHDEVTLEQYREAVKIAQRYYRDLSGKTLVGITEGLQVRKQRHVLDKRKAREILNEFSGYNAFDRPYNITVLVKRLLQSRFRVNADLLEKLQELKLLEGKVMLTESGTKPIEVRDDGTLVIDVRFASEDYVSDAISNKAKENIIKETVEAIARNNPNITPEEVEDYKARIREQLDEEKTPTVSFEYLALTAILTNVYAQKVQTNTKFKNAIGVLMETALKADLATTPQDEVDEVLSLPYYYDPVLFITEALQNAGLQQRLAAVEYNDGTQDTSLWEDLQNRLVKQGIIAQPEDLSDTLLQEILSVAQIGLTETEIDVINKEDKVEEGVDTEEEVGEEPVEEVVTDEDLSEAEKQREALRKQIRALTEEVDTLKKERKELSKNLASKVKNRRARIRLTNEINTKIDRKNKLKNQLDQLEQKASDIESKVDSTKDNFKTQDTSGKAKTDNAGKQAVSIKNKFEEQPREVQRILARIYFVENWQLFADPNEFDYNAIQRAVNNDEIDIDDLIDNRLSEDDIQVINESMQDPLYANAIIEYNLSNKAEPQTEPIKVKPTPKDDDVEEEDDEEVEEEDEDEGGSSDPKENTDILDETEWDADKIRSILIELQHPKMMEMYSEDELQPYVDRLNETETAEERQAILAELEPDVMQDYKDLMARLDALNKSDEDLEELVAVPEQHTRISGINIEDYTEARSKVQEGEVLTVRVQEGKGLFKGGKRRPEGYDYVIRIYNKDGEPIGTVGYNTPGAKAIMASNEPNKALIKIGTINEKDGKILFENVGVYVTDIKVDEAGSKEMELKNLLDSYKWNHRVNADLVEAESKAEVEKENRIVELVNELGAKGKAAYDKAFQEQIENQPNERAQEEFKEMFDVLKDPVIRKEDQEILGKIKQAEEELFRLERERRDAYYGSTERGHSKAKRAGYAKEVQILDKEIDEVNERIAVYKRQLRERDKTFEELLRIDREEREAAKSPRQKATESYLSELSKLYNTSKDNLLVNALLKEAGKENVTLFELIAIRDLMTAYQPFKFSSEQQRTVLKAVNQTIQRGLFGRQAVLAGSVVKIKSNLKHAGLFKLRNSPANKSFMIYGTQMETNKLFSFELNNFIDSIEEVIPDGTTVAEDEVKITITPEEAGDIQTSYTDIFGNFTKEIEASEYTDLSDQELEQEIIKELKCK